MPTWTTLPIEIAEPESATSEEEDELHHTPPPVSPRKRRLSNPLEAPRIRGPKVPRSVPSHKPVQRFEKPLDVFRTPFKISNENKFSTQQSPIPSPHPQQPGAFYASSLDTIPDVKFGNEVIRASLSRGSNLQDHAEIEVTLPKTLDVVGVSESAVPGPSDLSGYYGRSETVHQARRDNYDHASSRVETSVESKRNDYGFGIRRSTRPRDIRDDIDKVLGTTVLSCGKLPQPQWPYNLNNEELSRHMLTLSERLRLPETKYGGSQVTKDLKRGIPRKIYSVPQWSRDGAMHLRLISLFGPGYADTSSAVEKFTKVCGGVFR